MIIALCNSKGGVAKTTLAASIGGELYRRRPKDKHRVLLVDADPQGSLQKWRSRASADIERIWPNVVAYNQPILHKSGQVRDLSQNYDYVVIDTPPFDGGMATSALMIAHLVLIPVEPSSLSTEEITTVAEMMERARMVNPDLQAALVVSRKIVGTLLGQDIRVLLSRPPFNEIPLLQSETCMRAAYAEMTSVGSLIHEYAPKSKADMEIRSLVTEVLKHYNGVGGSNG